MFIEDYVAAVNNFLDILPDGYFNVHDSRFGFGGVFGVLYQLSCDTRFGIQYLTPVRLDFRAKPHFNNVGPILEGVLTNLGFIGSTLNLHVNVPQSVMLSAYHDLNPCLSLMGNLGWQQWSKFERVTISLEDLNNRTLTSKVKYQDTWHVAIGAEWYFSEALTFSGGIAYDSSAVSNAQRPLNFLVGSQWRFGTGARWAIWDNLLLDFSSELQWQGDLKADQHKPIAGHVSGMFENTYALFINSNITYQF